MSESPYVFFAYPTRGHSLAYGSGGIKTACALASKGGCKLEGVELNTSILEHTFNYLWAGALNARNKFGCTHFAMLHDDILPAPGWLDVLLSEQQRLDAAMISVVVALKEDSGLTSTAISGPTPWESRRLSLTELHQLPPTFSIEDTDSPDRVLLINTGCMLIDLTKPWVTELEDFEKAAFAFKVRTRIIQRPDGLFAAQLQSEDWLLSRHLAARNLPYYATRLVQAEHCRQVEEYFENHSVYGRQTTDNLYWERTGEPRPKKLILAA